MFLVMLHLGGREVRVDVERVDSERQHAKQMDLGVSDCFAGPVVVNITDFIVLEVTPETGLTGVKDAGQGWSAYALPGRFKNIRRLLLSLRSAFFASIFQNQGRRNDSSGSPACQTLDLVAPTSAAVFGGHVFAEAPARLDELDPDAVGVDHVDRSPPFVWPDRRGDRLGHESDARSSSSL